MGKPFGTLIRFQSERTILIGTVLSLSAVSAVTVFVLSQYLSVDALSSLVFIPDDCYLDGGVKVGRHCFSDYTLPVSFGLRANPWEPFPVHLQAGVKLASSNYPAAGLVPLVIFGVLGKWIGSPQIGLVGYLMALTIAVLTPAAWAAHGARGIERIVVFIACGVAAVPAWMAVDRGNSAGFLVPIALAFLVALARQRWILVAVFVVLAAMVKPQFALLVIVLFAARQWRWGGAALAGILVSNMAAYLLWPRDFPQTITQSARSIAGYGDNSFEALVTHLNVSFGKALLAVPDGLKAQETGGKIPDGFLAGPRTLIGYVIVLLVVASVVVLGRRIPPVMVGIVLLATAALFPALSFPYYLVFVLPVAALVVRDPNGPPGAGIFDQLASVGDRRRAVGLSVTLAVALSIAHIALPGPPMHVGNTTGQLGAVESASRAVVHTTAFLAPILWLIACVAIIVSYARRPAPLVANDASPAPQVEAPATQPAT
ncbi:glycosyltransferase family 87 protein [Mycobacterium camsae]|uniref:glycosyltransferase family 87 protein n=1 Tax=Mycobacterium gordonae TaxID=1778 RepID=UPI001F120D4C|nr:DUF2029 domain-containing protein [Mycobacterium gordonae]